MFLTFNIISGLIFLFLFLKWANSSWFNQIFKFALAIMLVFGVLCRTIRLESVYCIVSSIIFLFMLIIWSNRGLQNIIFRGLFGLLFVWGTSCALSLLGYI
jgi:hypothetical protein